MGDPDSDLSQLDVLTEDSILEAVKTRYQKGKIYTNVGDILLAVNPYKEVQLYDKQNHEKYGWKDFKADLPPHVFQVAARAYSRMRQNQTNQVILVCGESGSGKTESTKYMVQHFMDMCPEDSGDLHERIIRVNHLLESFGNAKTVMNENSSRFAKYLELSFREDGQVIGASIRDYMLEKCRVVARKKNCSEGNFHIFYGMFAGMSTEEKQELNLMKSDAYSILKGDIGCLQRTQHYAKQYQDNMEVLNKIGMTDADRKVMLCMLAAILHLTQIDFQETDETSGELNIIDTEPIEQAADLLMVDSQSLGHALISSTKMMAEEEVKVYKSLSQAKDGRDALAKHMYERLFGWIVKKINTNLHHSHSGVHSKAAEIGILDIAGFEQLQTNGFEQMCINMVNERLQQFMNNILIIQEKKIYEAEEIPFDNVDFRDNINIIELFEMKKIGVWPTLDEESKFAQSNDLKFVERLRKNFPKGHPYNSLLTFARGERAEFGVTHFAGAVCYNCVDILEKNRDDLSKDILGVMKGSKDDCIADLFTAEKGDTGTISNTRYNIRMSRKAPNLGGESKPKTGAGKFHRTDLGATLREKYGKVGKPTEMIYMSKDSKTVISYFQKSISQLLAKMKIAEPYFVRCIKPNIHMAPDDFNDKMVEKQLKYNGISEICRIRKDGYPSRILVEDFLKRYKQLLSIQALSKAEMTKSILDGLLPTALKDKYRIGKNKVFMKESVNLHMEKVYLIRQEWAASVISKGMKKICVVKKKERLKREEEEKERRRKEQEEKMKKKEQEEERKRKIEQKEKDEEKPTKRLPTSEGMPVNVSKQDTSINDYSNDDGIDSEESNEDIDNRFNLRGTKIPTTKTITSSSESSSSNETYLSSPSSSSSSHDSSKKKTTQQNKGWDIFKIIARETKTEDVHTHRSLRIIKVITYILLFLILLSCLVIQKISLITLTSELRPKNDTDTVMTDKAGASYMLTLIAMCTPYILIFMVSMWKSYFGNFPFPGLYSIIVCVVIEILHSIGLCLLVFHLLPGLGTIQGIGLLSAAVIIPSFLKPLFSNIANNNESESSKLVMGNVICVVLDILAFFVQLSAIPTLIVQKIKPGNDSSDNDTDMGVKDDFVVETSLESVKIVGAMLLCSLSWWENFIDDKACGMKNGSLKQAFLKLKFDLQESRPYICIIVSFFKIVTSFVFAYLLMHDSLSIDISNHFNTIENYSDGKSYSAILFLILSGYLGYYLAYTVCKLQMQKLSFSIPCLLSTPLAIGVVSLECKSEYKYLWAVSNHTLSTSCEYDLEAPWFSLPLAALWFLSFYWVGRHIWFPTQERLAKVERLFVNPMYCGILLEQHLVMNRKRHNRRIIVDPQNKTLFKLTKKELKPGAAKTEDKDQEIPPMIYACATTWHESRVEMVQLLKSLFRMDQDQYIRRQAYEMTGRQSMQEVDYYEFEAHIFFDDAFEKNNQDETVPNKFVNDFVSLMNEAASAVHSREEELSQPFLIPSHYGGQVVFSMTCGNLIYLHLKDKQKIRHRKRWSQVMYMYYLLGYRIVKEGQTVVVDSDWETTMKTSTGYTGKSQIFQMLDEQVVFKAENTFLLALDGDVDFTPGAVRLLLDRMRKNPKVGAACGRIHPIGSGPMVWYQKFEYAVAHWLQKSTEHVLGCVLCSPGCFSMFRGSALMDDNVMRKYTILPTEASHHLMYDQGEDRWLCTLLLQQGYRVDYAAASDAFTYAPESFNEYFNQRRRWTPSTIANILDLLQDGKNTVASNSNISWLYIIYQAALMVSTIIGPATVLMMIAGALLTVFSIDLVTSYIISLIPAIIFFVICFFFDSKIQLIVAQILSGVYIFIMMVVFVGVIITAVTLTPYHPSVIFLSGLVFIFLIAAAFHPREFYNLIFGILYFLWVPSGFLVLVIYSLCNLHVVSWGTREVPKKKTEAELEQEEKEKKEKEEKKKQESFWNKLFPFFNLVQDLKQTFTEKISSDKEKEYEKLAEILKEINQNLEKINDKTRDTNLQNPELENVKPKKEKKSVRFLETNQEKEPENLNNDHNIKVKSTKKERNDLINPAWVEMEMFRGGELLQMNQEEDGFWKGFVEKYLKPIDKNSQKEKEDLEKLMELRNNVCGGMALINVLWVAINFMFQYRKPTVVKIPLSNEADRDSLDEQAADNILQVDVVGLMFIIFFLLILFVQFLGMIVHRWGTFMHLIAITEIPNPFDKKIEDTTSKPSKGKLALEFCETVMHDPMPDYPMDDEENKEERNSVRKQIVNYAETGTKDRAGKENIGMSLRNSRKANEWSDDNSKHNNFNDPDFMKMSIKYTQNKDKLASDQTSGLRHRHSTTRGPNKKYNKSLHRDNDHGIRRNGFTSRSQTDENFMRKINFKLNLSHLGTESEETHLKQSYRRDTSNSINTDNEDNDVNFDQIPGKMDRIWAKKMHKIKQSVNVPNEVNIEDNDEI